jgi:ubiquinone/menaquinone biosynthesis C-methylase UbiE
MWPPRTAVEEMLRVARRGGMVIVTDMYPDAIKKGWKHSFRNGSAVYEIENRPYALEDLPANGLDVA